MSGAIFGDGLEQSLGPPRVAERVPSFNATRHLIWSVLISNNIKADGLFLQCQEQTLILAESHNNRENLLMTNLRRSFDFWFQNFAKAIRHSKIFNPGLRQHVVLWSGQDLWYPMKF